MCSAFNSIPHVEWRLEFVALNPLYNAYGIERRPPPRLYSNTFETMKKPQYFIALVAGLCVTLSSIAAEHLPDTLDMSDCRILAGRLHADAYRATLAGITKRAKAGGLADQRMLAAVATNRFACFLESVSASAGWSIVTDSKKNGSPGIVSTSTQLVDVETLKRNPEGLKALREAKRTAQFIADRDLAYRTIAAGYVADYKDIFQSSDYADAYRNAVGVRAVACLKDQSRTKRGHEMFCIDAKGVIAGLHSLLSADKRAQLEADGLIWAEKFMAGGVATRTAE